MNFAYRVHLLQSSLLNEIVANRIILVTLYQLYILVIYISKCNYADR